jgi:hypothetical protein
MLRAVAGGGGGVKGSSTFAALSPTGNTIGDTYMVTDANNSLWYWTGSIWRPVNGRCVLYADATYTLSPTDTNLNTMWSYTLPAGIMGTKGTVRANLNYYLSNSVNNKTVSFTFGGTVLWQYPFSSGTGGYQLLNTVHYVQNRGVTNSQIANIPGNMVAPYGGQSASSGTTSAIDTTAPVTVAMTVQKVVGAEILQLERVLLELIYP